jgi:hypothetical protein
MKTVLQLAVTLGLGLSGLCLGTLSASALPMNGRAALIGGASDTGGKVETVRWVCSYYGNCYWAPGRRAYGYWGGGHWGGGHWGGRWRHGHHGHGGHWGGHGGGGHWGGHGGGGHWGGHGGGGHWGGHR